MGLMEGWGHRAMPGLDLGELTYPNASKCATREAVEETNRNAHRMRVLEFKDVYGMMYMLLLCLGGATLVFIAECVVHRINLHMKSVKSI